MEITNKQEITEDLLKEIEIYRAIKPYIGHCLSMNHEINNPLAGIIGYSEFLLEESDSLDEEQKDYLKQIIICGERIKKIVENLCEEKIALTEKVDIQSIMQAYEKNARDLD